MIKTQEAEVFGTTLMTMDISKKKWTLKVNEKFSEQRIKIYCTDLNTRESTNVLLFNPETRINILSKLFSSPEIATHTYKTGIERIGKPKTFLEDKTFTKIAFFLNKDKMIIINKVIV